MSTFPLTFAAVFGEDGEPTETISVEQVTDHVERARLRVLEQYKDKPRLDSFVTIYVERIQDLENAAWAVFTEWTLDAAVGVQLDVLGRIVGLDRGGFADEDYRLNLRAQVKLLKSSGTMPQLQEILSIAVPGALIIGTDAYPAAFRIQVSGVALTSNVAQLLASFVRRGRGGGIRAVLEWQPQADSATFRWDTVSLGWDNGKLTGTLES